MPEVLNVLVRYDSMESCRLCSKAAGDSIGVYVKPHEAIDMSKKMKKMKRTIGFSLAYYQIYEIDLVFQFKAKKIHLERWILILSM